MNKDMLSQQEIDALLRGASGEAQEPEQQVEEILSEFEADALGEIGNICFGSAATALSTLLNQKVDITTPKVSIVKKDVLDQDFPIPHVAVKVEYTDGFEGVNVLAIRVKDAVIIADLMMGGDGSRELEDLNDMHLSAVCEAMNQMMGSASTSMSTVFSTLVNITPPTVDVLDFANSQQADLFPDVDYLVKISFRLIIGTLIDSHIMQLLPISFAKDMLKRLMGGSTDEPQESAHDTTAASTTAYSAPQPAPSPSVPPVHANTVPHSALHETAAAAAPAAPMYPQQQGMPPYGYPPVGTYQNPGPFPGGAPGYGYIPPVYGQPPVAPISGDPALGVQPVQFESFDTSASLLKGGSNLDLLLDIPLSITVELGRSRKQIREILELSPGSIIELDKLAGEPVDILVNNKLVAKGEVVVIEENFGVRVTDIVSPAERIKKLQ